MSLVEFAAPAAAEPVPAAQILSQTESRPTQSESLPTPTYGAFESPPAARPAPAPDGTRESPRPAPSASDGADARVTAESEHYFIASELTRLPRLPGEPAINLGEGSDLLDGSIALRLFIDERGRVVHHRVESREGLPDAIVDKLVTVFAGYPYIAGERQGLAVKCQVLLAIAVREGQAAMGGHR